jgi:hypothetical protein
MTNYLRLRQICLAAPRLAPLIADLQTIFRIEVCYRDPNVALYGLENALLPIGDDFLEVVSPLREDTAAGRFISRSKGHGGYMAIFQASDPRQRQAHAKALGIRTAHEIEREAYQSAQLHPRDCRASFIELGHSKGGESRLGTWWPAGEHWQSFIRTDDTIRLLGIDLEAPKPLDLATHWSNILQTTVSTDKLAPALSLETNSIRFVPGETECLGTLRLQVRELEATVERALSCGLRVVDHSFHLGGVSFQLST